MKSYRATYGLWGWFILDGILWAGALWVGLRLRFPTGIPAIEYEYFFRLLPLSTAGLLGSYLYCGVYRRDLGDNWKWRDLWWGWVSAVAVTLSILFFVQIPYSRPALLVGALLFLSLDVGSRAVAHQLNQAFFPYPSWILALGFEDEDRRDELRERVQESAITFDCPSLDDPSLDELQGQDPDMILVNAASYGGGVLEDLHDYGSRMQVPVRMVPEAEHRFFSRTSPVQWRGIRLLRSNLHYRFQQTMALKTVFDYVLGGLFFLLALPVMMLVAFAILLVDGRPVLYSQTRTGRGQRTFELLKFRTMVEDADERGPELTQGPEDPRITTLGRFLRRWSLDELPQFINVLRGEMSLVGPRPELPSITEDYASEQKRVLWLKPGLTGLSQVRGRQNLDLEEKLEVDQQYLAEYSIGLDLWILLRTVWAVLRGRGAA